METSPPSHIDQARQRRRPSIHLLSKIAILGIALFLVACAGMNSAASNSAPQPATPSTFVRTTGNALVTMVQQKPAPGAITVNITEVEFAIIPSITTFRLGVPYYFVVSNKGKQTHAFTFVPTYPNGTPMNEYYQYDHMLIELDTIPPGTTQMINHIFTKVDIGHYEMACRMRGHYMAGMHLTAQVIA